MKLSQFYTEKLISEKLISSLKIVNPKQAFGLGFGSGMLLKAAKKRWIDINLAGVDIDIKNILLAKEDNLIDALQLNGFSADLPYIIADRYGDIDILISNPPYFSKDLDKECYKILRLAGLIDCIIDRKSKIPAELIFLAQNLRLLSENSEIGIILPAGIISGERWMKLREFLFNEYTITDIIQIPSKSFKGTEAQTFIMTISKSRNNNDTISISHSSHSKKIIIPIDMAIRRADYNYYMYNNIDTYLPKITSDDFHIFRGNLSKKILEEKSIKYLHTTDMSSIPCKQDFDFKPLLNSKNCETGDILISRVGTRCLGRAIYINKGSIPISDCIIGVRPKNEVIGSKIWKKITSESGVSFFKNSALGVGPRYLTHGILKEFLTNKVV